MTTTQTVVEQPLVLSTRAGGIATITMNQGNRFNPLSSAMIAALQESIDAIAAGLEAVSTAFVDRREHSRRRQAVIVANAELQERELIKLASLSAALAGALRGRGVAEPAAGLTAEAGVAVFKVGFERWTSAPDDRTLGQAMREALEQLKAVTAGG